MNFSKNNINSVNEITDFTDWLEICDPSQLPGDPTVSVLMLAYNHGKYLSEAIEGVVNQKTDFQFELLIGEDCSTDNTREVAISYQNRYPKIIRIISSYKNIGASKNFIRLLNNCRGEILATCEGDDYWIDSSKLEKQINILKNDNIDLCFHSTYLRNFNAHELSGPHYVVRDSDQLISVEEVIYSDGSFMPSASLVIRRSALNRIPSGMLESAPIGDYILQVYGSLNGGAYYINDPMCVYRRGHPESWSVSVNQSEKLIAFENSFYKLINEIEFDLKSYKSSFNELIYRHYFPRFMLASISGNKLLKHVFLKILSSRMSKFNLIQKIYICASKIGFIAFLISKGPGVIRRVKKIQQFVFKYSLNRIKSYK